jgi:hypothetical protein
MHNNKSMRLCIGTIMWVFVLFASAMATFGNAFGIFAALLVLIFWFSKVTGRWRTWESFF